MLEEDLLFLFKIILIAVGLGFAAIACFVGAALVGLELFIFSLVGWIPVLICVIYSEFYIGVGAMGALAFWALYIYTVISIGIIIMGFIIEDADKIPPAFKFFALFYRHPTEGMQIIGNPDAFVEIALRKRTSTIHTRIDAMKMRKMAE